MKRRRRTTQKERRERKKKMERRAAQKGRKAMLDPKVVHPFVVQVRQLQPGAPIIEANVNARTPMVAAQALVDKLGKERPDLWAGGLPLEYNVTRRGLLLNGFPEQLLHGEVEPPEHLKKGNLVVPGTAPGREPEPDGLLLPKKVVEELAENPAQRMGRVKVALAWLMAERGEGHGVVSRGGGKRRNFGKHGRRR